MKFTLQQLHIIKTVVFVFALLLSKSAQSQCTELFFSEYVEGSGNDKAIEIYNPTYNPINLSSYSIRRYSNGAADYSAGGITNLVGTIAPFSTFVLVNGQTTSTTNSPACSLELQALADQLDGAYPSPTYCNGNDAIVLAKGNVIIDILGKIGEDPGTAWSSLFPHTANSGSWITWNHTMIRKSSVQTGVAVNPDFFDPLAQYDTLPNNTWTNLGIHNCICQQLASFGSISNNGLLSNNPNPITFTSNPAGCPSFSYQWYSKSGVVSAPTGSSTSGWTLIPGATSNTYDPPILFSSSSFACFVTPLSACGNAAWAGGVASFTITTSSGSVNTQQVSQCTFSSVSLTFDSQPVGLGNTSYQWYFANGSVSCPQGTSTSGWTAIAGATSSFSSFVPQSSGTFTLACLVTPEGITGLPAQWANGCKTVAVNSFNAQSIIGNPNILPFTPYLYLVSQTVGNSYLWTAYGGAISSGQGSNQVNVVWAATGPYQLMLIENNGVCSDTSYLDVENSFITQINETEFSLSNVQVFPNPTDVGFTIQSRQVKAGMVIQLYDQMGRMVLSDFISGESTYMNTSALASGIYLLRMPAYPGFTKKICIQ